jgi:hypothetical protein
MGQILWQGLKDYRRKNNQGFTLMLPSWSCQQIAVPLCHSLLIDIEALK